jgi:hypothetical protein
MLGPSVVFPFASAVLGTFVAGFKLLAVYAGALPCVGVLEVRLPKPS